jgi:hypothetical protein
MINKYDSPKDELLELIRLGRKYKWAKGETRRNLERAGVNLGRHDFYSETPSLDEIDASFEYADGKPPFFDKEVFDLDVNVATAKDLISSAASFDAPIDGDSGYFWNNGQFSSVDALAYYGLIKKLKPKNVIEIGSGFSTHIAHQAVHENKTGKLTCIDPCPRTEITELSDVEFLQKPIQEIDRDWLFSTLKPGDLLFYDGSHTIKTGSDTVYFYLKILPYLPAGVLVHAHDVGLPYPRNKRAMIEAKIYWGEQYILMAHLLNTQRYKVVFGTHFLQKEKMEVLEELMGDRYKIGGGSLWYEILGESAIKRK